MPVSDTEREAIMTAAASEWEDALDVVDVPPEMREALHAMYLGAFAAGWVRCLERPAHTKHR